MKLEKNASILHVAHFPNWHIGGPYESVPALIRSQHRLGLNVALLTSSAGSQALKSEGYPIFSVDDFSLRSAVTSLPAPYDRPQVMHFHGYYIWMHARLAAHAHQQSIPYLITPRGAMTRVARAQKRVKKLVGELVFQKTMVSNAAAIHCLTLGEAANIGDVPCPIYVVPNGIEPLEQLSNEKVDLSPNRNLHLLFLGRLSIKHKGLDLLVSAAALAKRQGVHFHLKLVGPDHAGGRAYLEKMIQNMDLADCVEVCAPVIGEKKHQAFIWADVFVHTSRFEGLPMAVLEALSYGVPCLLTPGTNMAEVVDAVGGGWSVPASTVSIAREICKIASKRDSLPEKRQAARQLADTKYSWSRIAADMAGVYQQIVAYHKGTL